MEAVKTYMQTPEYFQRPEDWDLFCAGLLAMAHMPTKNSLPKKSCLSNAMSRT